MTKKNLADKPPRHCTACRLCGLALCLLALLVGITAIVIYLVAKPPQVDFLGVVPGSGGGSVDGLELRATSLLRFQVQNPNPLGLTFTKIEGTGYIPGSQTPVASGTLDNVAIPKQSTTEVQFPLTVAYNPTNDKDFVIAKYFAANCGANGNRMPVNYAVKFYIVPLSTFGVVPSMEKTANVACPDISRIEASVARLSRRSVPKNLLAKIPQSLRKWVLAA